MSYKIAAIVVTHNSSSVIKRCIQKIHEQTFYIHEIVIVDSGSESIDYLQEYENNENIKVVFEKNIGFSKANNLGFKLIDPDNRFVIFLNPDTFIEENFTFLAVSIMESSIRVGALSGRLLGFDIEKNLPTGKIDSTGIFRKAYGRWYDREQNEIDQGQNAFEEEVPALCGALLFCRMEALHQLNETIFDPDFFLYKEDIEFSLRLKKLKWKILYSPELIAYHCRGWKNRSHIDYTLKKSAAKSEILLYKKHPSPYMFWALFKYVLVTLFRI